MNGREFKALQRHPSGNWSLTNISWDQQPRVHIYTKVLEVAKQSKVPDPQYSRYFCRESIGYRKIHEAGNIEYGFCCSLHGEVSGGAVLRASSGEPRGIDDQLVMGIIADDSEEGKPANPCGDCRDFMLDVFGPDLEIVSGPADGGVAVVAKLSDYLFDRFGTQDPRELGWARSVTHSAFIEGECLMHDAYSPPNIHPERKYYVSIFAKGEVFHGALDLMCDYHPIYPLRDAIRQARRSSNPFVESVLIIGADTSEALAGVPPHVMYKDRQHLFELNLCQELLSGKETDPRVTLVRCHKDLVIANAWETSVKEWLPFPFSPRNFGPEFVSAFTQKTKRRYQ